MASSYKTPGVYIEEISKLPPSVAQVETAIPAFIGYTHKATKLAANDLLFNPTRIRSLSEYVKYFGTVNKDDTIIKVTITTDSSGAISAITPKLDTSGSLYMMYYSLQMYFDNGGGPCYIISVGTTDSVPTSSALNPLVTGSASTSLDFEYGLQKLGLEDEPTLIVFPDAHLLNDASYYSIYEKALNQCHELKDRFAIIDVKMKVDGTHTGLSSGYDEIALMRNISSSYLSYGGAYYPGVKTSLNYVYNEQNVVVFDSSGVTDLKSLKSSNSLKYNRVLAEITKQLTVEMAPGAIIAGIYAWVDDQRGVWKAPANVGLTKVIKPVKEITDEDQESLNVDTTAGKSINVIRSFKGLGVYVWGARTLAGNDNEWRYLSVRRFYNMVEESVKKSSSWVVFEPNDANTWVKVKSMIENYLTVLWRQGALAGAVPEHAFFVKVGLGVTMTSLDILEGRMNIEIGMAVVRPAEFIILKFSHKMQES